MLFIKKVEFFSLQTIQVTNMDAMFQGCYELKYLDLFKFNISNVKKMGNMFFECHKLKEIKGINNLNTKI